MKKTIKKICASMTSLFMILTMMPMPSVAAATNKNYESISIAKNSLNGNAIWGRTEDYYGVAMDSWGHFYTKSRNGNGGLPDNGQLTMSSGVPYQLASGDDLSKAYDGNDCIRLTSSNQSQTMNLKTIGVYNEMYVLATAGGPGAGHYADFKVRLTYTDNTTQDTTYKLYDWFDSTSVSNVEKYTNIKRMQNNTATVDTSSAGGPILHSASIEVNKNKLLKSITFTMNGKDGNASDMSDLYCCIFAVTGATPIGVPNAPQATAATKIEGDTSGNFTANWNSVTGASSYVIDIAKDRNFTDIVSQYNNKNVGNVTCLNINGLGNDTVYYYRVRAVNSNGQSLSSNRIATDTPEWIKSALDSDDYDKVEYDAETNTVKFKENITLKNTITIPNNDSTVIDLNGNTVTAPEGKSAISSGSNSKVELTIKDSGNSSNGKIIGNGTDSNGNGVATIDFSQASTDSKITVEKTTIQGSNGNSTNQGTAGTGGTAISANGNVTITTGTNSTIVGGNGGNSANGTGGTGGTAISGGNIIIENNSHIKGGNGGNAEGESENVGGAGGTAVSNANKTNVTNGQVQGGTGGNASNGTGGIGGTAISGGTTNVGNNSEIQGGTGGNAGNGTGGNGGTAISSGNASGSTNKVTGGTGGNGTTASGTGGSSGISGGNSGQAGHVHQWKYTESQNKIKVYCENDSNKCSHYGETNGVTLILNADSVTYDGNSKNASLQNIDIFNELTGKNVNQNNILYIGTNSTTYAETTQAPTEPGDYLAKITVGGVTATKDFTINKKDIEPQLEFCDQWSYGSTIMEPTVTNNADEKGNITYFYKNKNDSNDEYKIVNNFSNIPVGNYVLKASIASTEHYNGAELTKEFEVLSGTINVSATTYENTYDGKEHSISVTVNNTQGAAIKYRTKDTGEYNLNSNPQFKDAGTYTVYYQVTKDNYKTVEGSAQVIINKREVTISDTQIMPSKEYDGNNSATIENNGSLCNIIKSDENSLSIKQGIATYNDKNVGTDKVVTFSGFEIQGAGAKNYELKSQPASTIANITQKQLTLKIKVKDKQYDGKTSANIQSCNLIGTLDDDDIILNKGTPSFNDQIVGKDKTIRFTDFSLGGKDKDNYSLSQPTNITATIYNEFAPSKNTEYTVNSNDWINTDFEVKSKEGYSLSLDNKIEGPWTNCIVQNEETSNGKLIFYVKNNSTGAISQKVEENYKIDKTNPIGDIEIGKNSIKKILNVLTFGWFFKEHIDVTISSSDTMSGIKSVEYQKVKKGQDYNENGDWINYSTPISIDANDKSIYYAKIIDKAGNKIIIDSEGVIVYSDATLSDSLSCTRMDTNDLISNIELNGNTVKSIKNGNYNLILNKDYEIKNNKIVLKNSYLKGLNADTYKLIVSYNPYGETFNESSKGSDANESTITLNVVKITSNNSDTTITTTEKELNKTYDGNETVDVKTSSKNTSAPVVEYKVKGAEDSTYTTTKPKDAGDYTVRVTYEADKNYEKSSVTKDFTISKAESNSNC